MAHPELARRDTARRDYRLYWAATTTDTLGSQTSGVVLPLFLLATGRSAALAGAVVSASLVAGLLAAPFAAVLADRGARRAVMWWSALAAAGAMGSIAALAATGRLPVGYLLAAVVAERIATSCYAAAARGCVAALVAPADYPHAVSRLQAGSQGAAVAGPVLGGALFTAARWLPFLADAVSYLVTAWCVRAMRTDLAPAPSGGAGAFAADLREGLRFTWRQPLLRGVLWWTAGLNAVLAALYFGAVFSLERHGEGTVAIGVVLAVAGAAGVAGALPAPWLARRVPAARLCVVVSWAVVLVAAGLAFATRAWVYGALFGVVSLLAPTLAVLLSARAIAVTPPEFQSRVGTVLATASGAATTVAPLAAGILVAVSGTTALGLTGAGVMAVVALYATLTVARHLTPVASRTPAEGAT
ncbi:MFS transporter [Streptomyces sp. NBC_01803]|uniref:MFS transporter n=1 Tax=Streptomyces sp. NBC_01803 TaxID=2975946 RepID=UPI002DD9AB15|nr:MFS transporter [Streptomyces sp. NBC_01803]WSA43110.1 MFS transporter [Streptomyces sp. NBC_01803]